MLESIDLSKKFDSKKEYKKALKKEQLKLLQLQLTLKSYNIPCILAVEGWDAAGKGGAIKRITQRIDPRGYEVHAIGAPEMHEKRHHYLRRFWLRIPPKGKIGIFDRSWYGRVLVERVENLASKAEWQRAYEEINQFEKLLHDDHYIIIKLWFHISKDEQLKRFKEREENPFKRWKITDEDWRNREKWEQYEEAVEDMFQKTNTDFAPWHIVEGEYKWYARVKTLKMINSTITEHLKANGIQPIQKIK